VSIYRFSDVPEEQEVPQQAGDVREERIYDDLMSLRPTGSQVHAYWLMETCSRL